MFGGKRGRKVESIAIGQGLRAIEGFLDCLRSTRASSLRGVSEGGICRFIGDLSCESRAVDKIRFALERFFGVVCRRELSSFSKCRLFPVVAASGESSVLSCCSPRRVGVLIRDVSATGGYNVESGYVVLVTTRYNLESDSVV